jgi:hypothetical protein
MHRSRSPEFSSTKSTSGDGLSQFEKADIIPQLFEHLKTRGFHWSNSIKIFNLLTFIKHGNVILVTYKVPHHHILIHFADKICLEFDKDIIQELLSILKTCDTDIQVHTAELLIKLESQAVKCSKCLMHDQSDQS